MWNERSIPALVTMFEQARHLLRVTTGGIITRVAAPGNRFR
jgi:hypothetical protein